MNTVELGIKVAATADVDAFDKVASSARSMGDGVDAAAAKADAASSRFDNVATSAENLDDRAGKATGALGALSAGFELVGAEKYAGALQGAAMATDFASGVGQAYNLVLELESVKRAKAIVTSGAHKAVTVATTAATKAAAAGQWALNAALSANPLGLVVLALVAVGAGLVLAYKKSETFRNIVDTAFAAAKRAVEPVVNTIGNIAEKVGDAIGWVRDKLPPAFESAKTKVVSAVEAMLAPITNVYNAVVNLIDKIKQIDFPDLPDIPGFRMQALTVAAGPPIPNSQYADPWAPNDPGRATVNITVQGAVDPASTARQLRTILTRDGYRMGLPT